MIPDADCVDFDKESMYSDLDFDKESIQDMFQIYFTFDYRKLPPFAKIIQSFILMQNTQKWNLIGGRFLGPFFKTSVLFHKKVSFLANIERCPKFQNMPCSIQPTLVNTDILTWSHWCLLSKGFKLCNNFVNRKFNTTFHYQRYLLFQTRQIQ